MGLQKWIKMNNHRANTIKKENNYNPLESWFWFFISVILFSLIPFFILKDRLLFSRDLVLASYTAKKTIYGINPALFDARVFLIPLSSLLQIPLRLIPIFRNGMTAGIIINVIFASGISFILVYFMRKMQLPFMVRAILMITWLAHPYTIYAVVFGFTAIMLVFLFLLILSQLVEWNMNDNWSSLVIIGSCGTCILFFSFGVIAILAIPVLLSILIAIRHQPKNPDFVENAFWIIITPIIYGIFIRFFFSSEMLGNFFDFQTLEFLPQSFLFTEKLAANGGYLGFSGFTQLPRIDQHMGMIFLAISAIFFVFSIVKRNWVDLLIGLLVIFAPISMKLSLSGNPIYDYPMIRLALIPFSVFLFAKTVGYLRMKRTILLYITVLLFAGIILLPFAIDRESGMFQYQEAGDERIFSAEIVDLSSAYFLSERIEEMNLRNIYGLDASSLPVMVYAHDINRFIHPGDSMYPNDIDDIQNIDGNLLMNKQFIPLIEPLQSQQEMVVERSDYVILQ